MKIICKYNDFYDFLTSDFDADICYVRKPELIRTYYEDMIPSTGIRCYRNLYSHNYKVGEVDIHRRVFGIYPNIYSQLEFSVQLTTGLKSVIPSKAFIKKIYSYKSSQIDKITNDIFNYCRNELMKDETIDFFPKLTIYNTYSFYRYLHEFNQKVECKEIFFKLGSPVYVRYEYDLFMDTVYAEDVLEGSQTDIQYVTNICFSRLSKNILKYWYDELNTINTYNNIENFLWSIKQEPISNPDNKTRILSHGFDLKTSFRKM